MNGFAQVLLDTYGPKFDAEGRDWLREILLKPSGWGISSTPFSPFRAWRGAR
jgi:hypothetical protein